MDDWLLTGVERAAFEETARDLQGRLTDAVIEDAVRRLPPEWYALGGERLVRDLKKRRDLLPGAAAGFYERLAKWVDVQGTDQDDVARLAREADGSAVLELSLAGPEGPVGALLPAPLPARGDRRDPRVPLRRGRPVRGHGAARAAERARLRRTRRRPPRRLARAAAPASTTSRPEEVVEGRGTGVSTRQWTPDTVQGRDAVDGEAGLRLA